VEDSDVAKLIGVVVIVLIAIVAVWLLGGRTRSFSAAVRIDRGAALVFPWLVEPPRLAKWIGGLVASRPQGDGELRVGARSIEVVEQDGRRTEMTTEVRALEPGRLLEVSLASPFLAGGNRFVLDGGPDGTRVAQTLTVRYRGAARLFGPFLAGAVRRKLDADLARLKAVVEGAEPAGSEPVTAD
jgi:uncharacterized protein YndB with AHSA1/START domain